MVELKKYLEECKKDLDKIGIQYSKNITGIKFGNQKRALGTCYKLGNYTKYERTNFSIQISNILNNKEVPEAAIKEVVMHELIHTCKNCFCHTGQWAKNAEIVKNKLGINVSRTTTFKKLGIPADIENAAAAYVLKCTKCGSEWKRYKKCKLVTNYTSYKCACGGSIERVK